MAATLRERLNELSLTFAREVLEAIRGSSLEELRDEGSRSRAGAPALAPKSAKSERARDGSPANPSSGESKGGRRASAAIRKAPAKKTPDRVRRAKPEKIAAPAEAVERPIATESAAEGAAAKSHRATEEEPRRESLGGPGPEEGGVESEDAQGAEVSPRPAQQS